MESYISSPGLRQGDITLLSMKHYAYRRHQHHDERTGNEETKVSHKNGLDSDWGISLSQNALWKEVNKTLSKCLVCSSLSFPTVGEMR